MDFTKILKEFPVIETQKLRLRQLRLEDAPVLVKYYSNEKVYRYLDWNGPETLERSYEVIKIWNQGYIDGWIIRFAIADKVTDEIIGTIFLSEFEGKRAEIGYELSESYWHHGIMSEAIHEVLSLGFEQLGLVRIQAFVCNENIASKEILKKFDFKEEGYLRQFECHNATGKCKDMYIYGLLKSYTLKTILDKNEKTNITNHILRKLPEWFGIEESIIEYINGVKDTDFYVAYDSNIPIGFISIKANNKFTAEVYVLGVLKEYHNQGIGKKLLQKAEEILKDNKYKFIMVKTLGESHPDVHYKNTRKFYSKVGFYPLEEIKEIWGKENPCLIMVKDI